MIWDRGITCVGTGMRNPDRGRSVFSKFSADTGGLGRREFKVPQSHISEEHL